MIEKRAFSAERAVMIAILTAIAAMSRVPFSMMPPGVQPTTFVVILSAIVFGGRTGFIIGALAALTSNIFLGHGPWTIWQMFAWGAIGLFFGIFKGFFIRNKGALLICAFISGVLFGFFMNLWYLTETYFENFWVAFFTSITTSIYFDVAHGITNFVLIYFFFDKWHKILIRAKTKYGI